MPSDSVRLALGRSLALSLEFLLGADILRTAVEPSWDEIGRLAAIATIRTALNYFLQREIAAEARMTTAEGLLAEDNSVAGARGRVMLWSLPRLPRYGSSFSSSATK